ncbi:hypothetical protein OIU85_020247 [Salix viminalis]|uniref:HAT C-terminal dimerisation domain-containing protein n=1 Tax=Salix viminalis TaxID=40686 RepID=A0A9Q0UG14_SALVM|nr:hypothetical protein OIU85_020247 [Salix viminalis]
MGTQSIAYIYNDMCRAKHAIKVILGDDARKYGPFWTVIENQWSSLFHHPLYMAAYFLNPSYRYRPDFLSNPEVIRGLNECIARLEVDNGKRISASIQIPDFVSAKADFGTDLALSTRMELDPELQRIAIRILSQTCSSLICEHTWSIYDHAHGKRRSTASRKRWNELTFVHYNLRLRERQLGRKPGDVVSFDNLITENILDDWLVESEKQTMQEDEEILYNEMEQFDGDEMDENDHQEKRPADMVTLAGLICAKGEDSASATYARVVRTGVPRAHGGRSNRALIQIPFLFIILGTVGLGGLNATRAYKKQKEAHPSHNPFLP